MIDSNSASGRSSGSTLNVPPSSPSANLFNDIFGLPTQESQLKWRGEIVDPRRTVTAVPPPMSPSTLAESGLTLSLMCDLILKQLYLHGNMVGVQIARHARLPFQVIDEGLRFL